MGEALASSEPWLEFIGDAIAAHYLADLEAGRICYDDGSRKLWRDDDELEALVQRYYEEIQRSRTERR